jgi:hypothetical protein
VNTDKKKPTPQPSRRREGARYETCRECGLEWNVSVKAEIPLGGYLCPKCRAKYIRR